MARPKAEKLIPACPICGNNMQVEYNANMNQIAGTADWHLDFTPRIKMCADCNRSLVEAVNKWFKKQDKTGFYKKRWVKT